MKYVAIESDGMIITLSIFLFQVTVKNGTKIKLTGDELHAALQYLPTNGHGGLVDR